MFVWSLTLYHIESLMAHSLFSLTPIFVKNIKGLFAKILKKMEMEKTYSDFIATVHQSKSCVLIAEEVYRETVYVRFV